MKPLLVLAGLGILAAAATPAAAQCGCYHAHKIHYVHHRYYHDYPPARVIYREPIYEAPPPRPVLYAPAYPPPAYGWGPGWGWGYGWGHPWGPRYGYGWGHPWGFHGGYGRWRR